jgi:hypothetical protein
MSADLERHLDQRHLDRGFAELRATADRVPLAPAESARRRGDRRRRTRLVAALAAAGLVGTVRPGRRHPVGVFCTPAADRRLGHGYGCGSDRASRRVLWRVPIDNGDDLRALLVGRSGVDCGAAPAGRPGRPAGARRARAVRRRRGGRRRQPAAVPVRGVQRGQRGPYGPVEVTGVVADGRRTPLGRLAPVRWYCGLEHPAPRLPRRRRGAGLAATRCGPGGDAVRAWRFARD